MVAKIRLLRPAVPHASPLATLSLGDRGHPSLRQRSEIARRFRVGMTLVAARINQTAVADLDEQTLNVAPQTVHSLSSKRDLIRNRLLLNQVRDRLFRNRTLLRHHAFMLERHELHALAARELRQRLPDD
jgi:hypothetical protein